MCSQLMSFLNGKQPQPCVRLLAVIGPRIVDKIRLLDCVTLAMPLEGRGRSRRNVLRSQGRYYKERSDFPICAISG